MPFSHLSIDPERMSGRLPRCAAAALLAVASVAPLAAAAEEAVYRWVDASGVVHFSQVAPQGFAYERVTPGSRGRPVARATLSNPRAQPSPSGIGRPAAPSPQPSADPADAPAAALTETQRQLQQELEQEAQERLGEVRALREANCAQAREQFRQFTTYARIRVSDESGAARVLSEEERQQRIDEAQEAIVLNCENGAG